MREREKKRKREGIKNVLYEMRVRKSRVGFLPERKFDLGQMS